MSKLRKTILCRCDEQYDPDKFGLFLAKVDKLEPHRPSTILIDSKANQEYKNTIEGVCKYLEIPNFSVLKGNLLLSMQLTTEMQLTKETLSRNGRGWWETKDIGATPGEWFYGDICTRDVTAIATNPVMGMEDFIGKCSAKFRLRNS